MNRTTFLKFFLMPTLLTTARSAVSLLRARDDNSTGFDDAAADAGDRFITACEEWLNQPESKGGAKPNPKA